MTVISAYVGLLYNWSIGGAKFPKGQMSEGKSEYLSKLRTVPLETDIFIGRAY